MRGEREKKSCLQDEEKGQKVKGIKEGTAV